MFLSEGVVRISFREEAFQVRFQEPFRLIFCFTLLLCELLFLKEGSGSLLIPLLVVPLFSWLCCAAAVQFLSWRYQFHVGPDQIACFDFWCRPQKTPWSEITGARYINYLGVDYLLLASENTPPIWVPLFVERYDLLRDLLVSYSDPALKVDSLLPEPF